MEGLKRYEKLLGGKEKDANHDKAVLSDIRVLEMDIQQTKNRYDCLCKGGMGLSKMEFLSGELKGTYNKVKPSQPYKYSQMSR